MNAEPRITTEAPGYCDGHWPGWRCTFLTSAGPVTKCLGHAMLHRRLFLTAIATAAVVGTILTTINQGNIILGGSFPPGLFWKIPLTYCVPYCVSTFSQLRISSGRGNAPLAQPAART